MTFAKKLFSCRSSLIYFFLLILSVTIGFFLLSNTDTSRDEGYSLPEISQLPHVTIPGFNFFHPRLPAPNDQDIYFIQTNNPSFFKNHRIQAKQGKLYSRILIAKAFPGEINLDHLYKDLMALQLSWRGHEQTKPLALAYDWLYYQWTEEQRLQLTKKVKAACEYQIEIIRNKKTLSPYNVYLYNSPFQALITAALAIHTEIPEVEDNCMRFTHDYWVNRVLPVWRQVMGENGGWHEGGEYIGIGIGQAIYQVPAMWRSATGEDYFPLESGIKGFLDFLIYRTRPDGTHMRWGDIGYSANAIPDQLALAIEYQNKAAYSLVGCPDSNIPSAYPWGPLTSNTLCDKKAVSQLPLSKYFDGIGMVVARNSWHPDATYAVFKAGNNYWSHSHLDQGSFTIYKGGPLLIDSGLYGPKYGSNHHMNYTYQTIAHNVITVTDNEDTLPLPGKKDKQEPRHIANDGGQRRVGSGWGKSAPLDLVDWLKQRDTYHTGKIAEYFSDDDFVVAIADLTAAYTNNNSGKDTFFDRTRRVEDYWRTFVYDRVNDIVLVFDNISASNPSFTKRSIFHTINKPFQDGSKIISRVYSRKNPTQQGGTLEATILFPKQPYINIIGGKGEEFLVGKTNYDEQGKVWELVKKRKINPPEPGSWRVEIIPPFARKNDLFLTVYNPYVFGQKKEIVIEPLESDSTIGCKITGESGTNSFIFSKTLHTLSIDQNNDLPPREITISAPGL